MIKKIYGYRRGDTLVEVLFAITFFSTVVLSVNLMVNVSLSASRSALELSLVRNYIDSQAASLRFLQNAYITTYNVNTVVTGSAAVEWGKVRNYAKTNSGVIDFGVGTTVCPEIPDKSFIIDPKKSIFVPYATNKIKKYDNYISRIDYNPITGDISNSYGIWVEALRTENTNSAYIDFHIRACWFTPGKSVPNTLATIVRLYDVKD